MNRQLLNDPDWLEEMYYKKKLNTYEIAVLADCSTWAVRKGMTKFGMQRRSKSIAIKMSWSKDSDRKELYSKRMLDYWDDPENKEIRSQKIKEYYSDPTVRKLMSIRMQEYYSKHENREAVSLWMQEHYSDPNNRKKASERMLDYFRNPENVNKILSGEDHPNWRGGIDFGPYTVEFNKEFKEYIRDLQDNLCFVCGKLSDRNKLDVHHIDYDKKNTTVENCIALCSKCHGKTNFNRDEWQGYFEEVLAEMEIA